MKHSNFHDQCVISGFHHEADENCIPLGYYTANNGNFLPTFQEILDPLRWDQMVILKHWYEITTTCCIITQKSAVLIHGQGKILTCDLNMSIRKREHGQ